MYVVYKFHQQGNELPGLIFKLITKLVFLYGPDTLPILPNSTELSPPVSAFITYNKCCPSFISTMSLHLCERAVLLFTYDTNEQVSLGPTSLGHLMLPDGSFGQVFPHLFGLITSPTLQQIDQEEYSHTTHFSLNLDSLHL